jgi:acyl-CoA synthetase (AMP-forming)/AMP-acid ligase II/acyl carrier protein
MEQYYPCYGLAESTLISTGGNFDDEPVYFYADIEKLEQGIVEQCVEEPGKSKAFVGCGYPMAGTTLAIVDPETMETKTVGLVGEIWIAGLSVAKGYWNNETKSEETFQAYTRDGKGPFMRTGDLGFIHEGQLYIPGRIKDLIIIRGLNHYPQDIEATVEDAHEAIQSSSTAAFAVDKGKGDVLAVVAEIKRTFIRKLDEKEVIRSIREAISEVHQLEIKAIALVRTGTVPKTSSGKIRRFECRDDFMKGQLQSIAEWSKPEVSAEILNANESEILSWMRQWIARELKVEVVSIDPSRPLNEIGMDSVLGVVMAKDAEEQFGMEWPIDLFLEETTLEKIAAKGAKLVSNSK